MDQVLFTDNLQTRECPWISWGNRTIKRFQSLDLAQPHCFNKAELCGKFSLLTGLSKDRSATALNRLFALQPSLTYGKYGALCKKSPVSEFPGTAWIPQESVDRIFPPDWYITLQIPEEWICRMVWSCWRYTGHSPLKWSSAFSEKILCLLKRRRGFFLQQYPVEELKFFWLEYGSIHIEKRT